MLPFARSIDSKTPRHKHDTPHSLTPAAGTRTLEQASNTQKKKTPLAVWKNKTRKTATVLERDAAHGRTREAPRDAVVVHAPGRRHAVVGVDLHLLARDRIATVDRVAGHALRALEHRDAELSRRAGRWLHRHLVELHAGRLWLGLVQRRVGVSHDRRSS